MKRRLETILFLASFAILMELRSAVVTSESNQTYLNSKTKPRIPLCCYNYTYFVIGKFDCEESTINATIQEKRVPEIYDNIDLISKNISMSNEHFVFVVQRPSCVENEFLLLPNIFEENKWYLLSNGSILRPLSDLTYYLLDYHQYCLTRLMSEDKDKVYPNYFVHYCKQYITSDEEADIESRLIYSFGMLISLPFLIATYIVYWLLPELRNVHGQTLLKYVGCLITTYSTFGTIGIEHTNLIQIQEIYPFCIIIALTVTFTFMASFFWLNVMCFDIWWTLREFRSLHGSIKQKKRKKFVIYSIYAWGSALFFTSVSAIMDFVPDIPEDFRPQFCLTIFWYHSDLAEMLYFWGPISITIIFNICLFISTTQMIKRHKKNTIHLKSSESRRHVDREQRFSIYFKLFIVMGMSWSLEIVSWIMEIFIAYVPTYFWYLIGLTNILQGLVIFILFVLKKKTRNLLIKRLNNCRFCPRKNLTNNDRFSSVSHTTTTLRIIPLQNINLHS